MGSQREMTVSQMNLTLRDQPALTLPAEKQRELGLALLELLLNAEGQCAEQLSADQSRNSEHQGKGDQDHDESQTHR
jgi:hypothetical protein